MLLVFKQHKETKPSDRCTAPTIMPCTLAYWTNYQTNIHIPIVSLQASSLMTCSADIKQHVNAPANVTSVWLDAGTLQHHQQHAVSTWHAGYSTCLFTVSLAKAGALPAAVNQTQTQKGTFCDISQKTFLLPFDNTKLLRIPLKACWHYVLLQKRITRCDFIDTSGHTFNWVLWPSNKTCQFRQRFWTWSPLTPPAR